MFLLRYSIVPYAFSFDPSRRLSPGYAEVVRATPQLVYRRSVWVKLAMGVLAVAVGVAGWAFGSCWRDICYVMRW